MARTMHARNAISAKMAQCYITLDGIRYNFMSAINVSVTFDKTKITVPILGQMNRGNKSVSSEISGSAQFHYNTSVWRELAFRFQETGEDIYFDMQITNEDPTSVIGKQTVILYDCNLDSILLAAFDADSEDVLTETIDFTAERFEIPEKFALLDGML